MHMVSHWWQKHLEICTKTPHVKCKWITCDIPKILVQTGFAFTFECYKCAHIFMDISDHVDAQYVIALVCLYLINLFILYYIIASSPTDRNVQTVVSPSAVCRRRNAAWLYNTKEFLKHFMLHLRGNKFWSPMMIYSCRGWNMVGVWFFSQIDFASVFPLQSQQRVSEQVPHACAAVL